VIRSLWLSVALLLCAMNAVAQRWPDQQLPLEGDPVRGRLVFGPCRTCHYPDAFMGHNFGPNLHRIFGRVAGKQEGFEYYSDTFKTAQFVWTPRMMYTWLENPMAMFPESRMMSAGVPDPQRRADLIAFLMQAAMRGDPFTSVTD
jgi:cytochrome c